MPMVLLTGAGLAINAYGAYQGGQQQAASAESAARVQQANAAAAEYNAQLAEQNAQIARDQKAAATDTFNRQTERTIGKTIAAYGASGVQTDVGSPLDVLADTARLAELDKLTLQYNYDLKIRDYMNQAALNRMNAANGVAAASTYASAAPMYSTAGTLNAIGTGLTGAANIFKMTGTTSSDVGNWFSNFFGGGS